MRSADGKASVTGRADGSVERVLARPRAVVEVRDMEHESELVREIGEQEQQRCGVRATGDGHDEGTGFEDAVRVDVVADGRADVRWDQLVAGVGIGPTTWRL